MPQIRTVADPDAAHAFGATVRHAITEVPWLLSRQSIEAHLRSTGLDALVEGSTISIRDGPRFTFDDLGRVTAYEETLRA